MKLSSGQLPDQINVLIEIPAGSSIKYEFNKKIGIIEVDRFSHTAMHYPFNYGYVPNTLAEDGDPIDVMVVSSQPVQAGAVIKCQPIGMLEMEDEAGIDTKIIATPLPKIDPFTNLNDISDLSESKKNLIKHFFEHYKELEPKKWVKVKSWQDRSAALEAIKKSQQ